VFELLSLVLPMNYQRPFIDLREIVSEIIEAAPEVSRHPKFNEINEFILKNN